MLLRNAFLQIISDILDSAAVGNFIRLLDGRSANRMCELGMICQAFEFKAINCVPGDYFEFGLFRGKTFRYAQRMKYRFRQHDVKLWGFDSFQGLPPIQDGRDNVWRPGEFTCSERELRQILRRSGFREHEYELIPGFYHDSLNDALHERLKERQAAIVYVDCDLYESTAQVLQFIYRYLVNGSIVCFDDYYCYKGAPDQGEQRALSEFLSQHPEIRFLPYFNYSPVGKSFIVRAE